MRSQEIELPELRVATPCTADWAAMQGDERSRFCGQCQKHVYNLTLLDSAELQLLIVETEGHFCGRLYERPDGTALTVDCPVGVARLKRATLRTIAVATAIILAIGAGILNSIGFSATAPTASGGASTSVMQHLRAWFKPTSASPPGMIMGDICVAPAPAAPLPAAPVAVPRPASPPLVNE